MRHKLCTLSSAFCVVLWLAAEFMTSIMFVQYIKKFLNLCQTGLVSCTLIFIVADKNIKLISSVYTRNQSKEVSYTLSVIPIIIFSFRVSSIIYEDCQPK